MLPSDPSLPPDAIAALQRGRKIEAIKLMREKSGLGLKEAKDAVDAFERANPVTSPRLAPGEEPRSRLGWLLAAVIAALLAVYWFYGRGS